MYSPALNRLNAEGKLVLYHDYRLGTARDWSSKGNHGTFGTNTYWSGHGLEFDRNDNFGILHDKGYVRVEDVDNLDLSAVTIFCTGQIDEIRDAAWYHCVVSKWDNGAARCNYAFTYEQAAMKFGENASVSLATTAHIGSKSIACSAVPGVAPKFYVNGAYVGAAAASTTMPTNAGPLTIGSWYLGNRGPYCGIMKAVCIFNVELTADQISAVHAELA